MANSSDWLEALAAAPDCAELAGDSAPGWLAALDDAAADEGGRFREAALFSAAKADTPAPPPPVAPEAEPEAAAPDPHAEALARAYADGLAAGRAAAEAEGKALGQRQRALRLAFRALDEAALAVLAEDLVATVETLCAGVLGEAARVPESLRARCDAAARRIGGAPDGLVLHLHPDDIALLKEEGTLAALRIAPDASLEPGSLVIEGADGTISDGPAEWRRAIATAVRG
ncbi:MAG: hypothetical protein KAF27_05375 [Porphyrobacter sp.]|nr:hypothetical protein [Porphyrobacter sp.]